MMHGVELVLVLLAAVTVLGALSERTTIPYPIFLVLGGLVLGFIPGMPAVDLDPELVFVLFLPPILFSAAYDTSWRDFRVNLHPITLLAIECVLCTTLAGGLCRRRDRRPTLAVAATTIFQRLLDAHRRFQIEHLAQITGVRSVKTEIPMQTIKQSTELPLPDGARGGCPQ